jgi:hypothetical protein
MNELIYGVIFSPTATFRKISAEPPLFRGFIIFLTVIILTSLVNTLIPPDLSGVDVQFTDAIAKAGPYLGVIGAVFSFLGWFIQAGIYHLFAELVGGHGKATGVLTVLALSELPKAIIIPLQVISYFKTETLLGKFLSIAAVITAVVWGIILLVIGLKEIHQISTSRAIAVVILPLAVMFISITVMIAASVGLVILFL